MFRKKRAQGKLSIHDPSQDKRLLIVNVIEARNIIGADRKGLSDAYVACCLVDLSDREVRAEKFVTQPVKGTVNPTFGQTFSFGKFSISFLKYALIDDQLKSNFVPFIHVFLVGNSFELDTTAELPSLKFALYHKGGFTVSEVPLGVVQISCSDIDPDGVETTELWYIF